MYNGVKAMITKEKELAPPEVHPVALQVNVEESKEEA